MKEMELEVKKEQTEH